MPIARPLALLALLAAPASAAIHIEIEAFGTTPDGADTDIAQFDTWGTTTWSVWVWSDEPGVTLYGLEFGITADPNLTLTTLGAVNPAAPHTFSFESAGTLNPSAITGISLQDPSLAPFGYALPTSAASAWLVYDAFGANGGGAGVAGLEPPGRIDAGAVTLNTAGATPDVIYHGVQSYVEPAPAGVALLALATPCLGARRRRR